jgi:hypothetical protein
MFQEMLLSIALNPDLQYNIKLFMAFVGKEVHCYLYPPEKEKAVSAFVDSYIYNLLPLSKKKCTNTPVGVFSLIYSTRNTSVQFLH